MSKLSKAAAQLTEQNNLRLDETVKNFMGGDSYAINPLETLKLVTASSIFGEPQYYRGSVSSPTYHINPLVKDFSVIGSHYKETTEDVMLRTIRESLSYDFEETLNWAVILRNDYNIRLNSQIIMVEAACHENRQEFTAKNPGKFNTINQKVMQRADESLTQIAYYIYRNNGSKSGIPSVLKRSWREKLSKLSRYQVAKYKNHEIGMINGVRICHAYSEIIDELIKTGKVEISEAEQTWENLRSKGVDWETIFNTVNMGHMALLRNIKNVFQEVDDMNFCKQYMEKLKSGVLTGKQFPFRYYAAYMKLSKFGRLEGVNNLPYILDSLEECIDISIENLPKLKGKTMCLSDNSGSAWGSFTSEYGSNTVAEIDNLSSVIAAKCSDEGYVGKFGNTLRIFPVSQRDGILSQTATISADKDYDVGGDTEGGIWEFFSNAIENKEYFDNIFIFSDMQAGHGDLYGTTSQCYEYSTQGYEYSDVYINVFKLIQDYRRYVNSKVNVFCVQTAGYNNTLLPEYAYRTSLMSGWTGKEILFANTVVNLWDSIDNKNEQ